MFKNKITLMVVPDSQGTMKQISIPRTLIWGLGFAAVALLFASVFLSSQFFSERVARAEMDQLRNENQELIQRFERMRVSLAEVEGRYDDLVAKEVAVRHYFDLPEIPVEERQLGIGGPIAPAVAQMTVAEKQALRTENYLDRLLRISEFEIDKYGEVEEALIDIKDRLQHTPSIWPTRGWKTSNFGNRNDPFTGYPHTHYGLDISNRRGTPIIATADGKITRVAKVGRMGLMVTVDHGFGFVTRFGHLHEATVKVGQRVKRGEQIALMGSSGRVTGSHLHYEVRRNGQALNPLKHILNEM
jgi:murein DD-endopeptidase MepM/ murein hydrolase activator NlpD